MKKLILSALFLLAVSAAFSQGIDKPKYRIEAYRLSNYLGAIEIELFPLITPLHVHMFDSLTSQQFFDSTAFHRVVPGFVIQGGDPNSISGPISTWGQGQPWQPTVPAEFNAVRHLRGIIGAARDADPNSANSQFYICVGSPTYLDGNYTVFGRVTSGMDVVDTIANSPRDITNDVPLQKISMFVTYIGANPSVPAAPVLSLPADGATGITNTQIFTWAAVDSAVLYTIQFSTDSTFATISYSDTVGMAQARFQPMQGTTTYYWRVKANNGGYESNWSAVWDFTSTTGSAALVYPPDTATGIPVNLNFVWNSVTGATSYRLQISTTSVFAGTPMIYNQNAIPDTFQSVTTLLQPNTLYYWRVQSENGSLPGMYSTRYSFTTGTSTAVQEANAEDLLLNGPWPNPATELTTLSIISRTDQEVEFILRDLSGRVVLKRNDKLTTGNNSIQFTVDKFKPGLYLLVIRLPQGCENRQLVIE